MLEEGLIDVEVAVDFGYFVDSLITLLLAEPFRSFINSLGRINRLDGLSGIASLDCLFVDSSTFFVGVEATLRLSLFGGTGGRFFAEDALIVGVSL